MSWTKDHPISSPGLAPQHQRGTASSFQLPSARLKCHRCCCCRSPTSQTSALCGSRAFVPSAQYGQHPTIPPCGWSIHELPPPRAGVRHHYFECAGHGLPTATGWTALHISSESISPRGSTFTNRITPSSIPCDFSLSSSSFLCSSFTSIINALFFCASLFFRAVC